MRAPCCCGVEFDTQVCGIVDRLHVLSMNGVCLGDWVTLPGEVNSLTLGCVEVHEPVLPVLESVHDSMSCCKSSVSLADLMFLYIRQSLAKRCVVLYLTLSGRSFM